MEIMLQSIENVIKKNILYVFVCMCVYAIKHISCSCCYCLFCSCCIYFASSFYPDIQVRTDHVAERFFYPVYVLHIVHTHRVQKCNNKIIAINYIKDHKNMLEFVYFIFVCCIYYLDLCNRYRNLYLIDRWIYL